MYLEPATTYSAEAAVAKRRGLFARLVDFVEPPAPAAIADTLLQEQFQQVGACIPILYLALSCNLLAALFTFQTHLSQLAFVGAPLVLLALSVVRLLRWSRWRKATTNPGTSKRKLRSSLWNSAFISGIAGLWGAWTFLTIADPHRMMVLISVTMAVFSGICCLWALPRAASLAALFGLLPILLVMVSLSDPIYRATAISVGIVVALQLRLIQGRYAELLRSLIAEHDLHVLANTDALTKLANRRAFNTCLESSIEHLDDHKGLVLVLIDLDDFKGANDQHGHPVGDAILLSVGQRLTSLCPQALCVARLGGDEFAVITTADIIGDTRHWVSAARAMLSLPYLIGEASPQISASIGITHCAGPDCTPGSLLSAADRGLYADKYRPQNRAAHGAARKPSPRFERRANRATGAG